MTGCQVFEIQSRAKPAKAARTFRNRPPLRGVALGTKIGHSVPASAVTRVEPPAHRDCGGRPSQWWAAACSPASCRGMRARQADTAAVRLALLGDETEHAAARTDAAKGALTRDYKRRHARDGKACRGHGDVDVRTADDRRHRRLGLRGEPATRPVERGSRLHELARLGELRLELRLALARRRQDVQVGARSGAARRQGHDVPRRRRHRARGRHERPPLLQRPDARELQRRALGRPGPHVHVQQHRRPGHDRRPTVVRRRRRSGERRLGLPHERRGVQRERAVRQHTARTTRSSCIAHLRRRGSDGRPRVRTGEPRHGAGHVRRGDHGQQRGQSRRDEDRRERGDAHDRRQARLRRPRRRQPHEDPHRTLLPGRVRCADRERQRPERAQLRRPPRRGSRDQRCAPAATSPRSRSTRPGTSTRSGSRRRTTRSRRRPATPR